MDSPARNRLLTLASVAPPHAQALRVAAQIPATILVEVYRGGRGGVRAYSADYLMASAWAGGVYIAPTHTWGGPGSTFSGRC